MNNSEVVYVLIRMHYGGDAPFGVLRSIVDAQRRVEFLEDRDPGAPRTWLELGDGIWKAHAETPLGAVWCIMQTELFND